MRLISCAVLQLCHGTKVVKGCDEVDGGSLSGMAFSPTRIAQGCVEQLRPINVIYE